MAFYYFHIEDGAQRSAERIDLPSLEAARGQATAYLSALMHDAGTAPGTGDAWQLRVTDEMGLVCFSLQFAALGKAAQGVHSYRSGFTRALRRLTPSRCEEGQASMRWNVEAGSG